MKYYVEIEGRTYAVEVDGAAVRLDGREVAVDLESSDGSRLKHLILDGRSHTLRADRVAGHGAWQVVIDGHRHDVVALDERARAIRDLSASQADSGAPFELRAPMPGLVISVAVEMGSRVERSQGVVVIEAMKMENELKAEAAGQVTEVRIKPGQVVNRDETLLVIEPEPQVTSS